MFRKHSFLAFLFSTGLWLSCVRYRKGALNMWRFSLLNYLVLMRGARWRALGTQVFFSSAKLPWNKKWQMYQAPVTGSSCGWVLPWSSWPRGGQGDRGTGLLCQPSLQPWDVPWRWHSDTHCVRPGSLGCCLLIPHKFCWQVGLNWFNSPVIEKQSSKEENCFLTGVGLDGLMDCLLFICFSILLIIWWSCK